MDPYEAGIAKGRSPSIKKSVHGQMVVVLDTRRENRQLELIHPYSRCVSALEVHELVLTDDVGAKPGTNVDRVTGVGFMAFSQSGVLMVGDRFLGPDQNCLGVIAGFDVSHYPNHFNILLYSELWQTGRELGLNLDDGVHFSGQPNWYVATGDG